MNGPIEFPESPPLKRFIPPNGRGTYGSWVKYHGTRWFGMYTRASAFLTAFVLVAVLDPILIPIIDSAQFTRVTNDGTVAPLEGTGFVVLLLAFFLIGRLVTAPMARLILIVVVGMAISRFSRRRMRAHTGGVPLFAPRAHPHPHETPDGRPENEPGPDPDDEPDDRSKR